MTRRKRQPDAESEALGAKLGKTILRLRQGGKLSLGDLSDQSGVAKSMISQIEKNETNPTLATLSRISRALGTSVEAVLSGCDAQTALVEHAQSKDIPVLHSEDGLCVLKIIGSIDTVEFVQVYDFTAKPGGILESSPHPAGSIENLTVLQGQVKVQVGEEQWEAKAGETLRYRGDKEHAITNIGTEIVRATMVNILAHRVGR